MKTQLNVKRTIYVVMGTLRTNTNIPALDEFVVIRTLVFEN